jgi:Flp pilus assembly protein TadD
LLLSVRSAEAVALLQLAIQCTPPYPRVALLLVRHYLDTGQPGLALEVATPWCESGKADADLSALHVAAYAALGRQSEAVANYRLLVERAPDNPVATHTLAIALNAAQQPAEAERVVRQSLLRNPPTAALHYTHARSLLSLERFDEAELALRECVRLDPRRAEAHDRLAQLIWMRTGNIVEATRALDQALEKFPHDDALRGISSAFYIQLPDCMRAGRTAEGILSFGAPGILTTPSLRAELSVRPEVGLLVLFPSYFWHGTLPFHSEQPRLTVAFDAVPDTGTGRP